MRDENAARLLATIMNWEDERAFQEDLKQLQLLATYKYDGYQRFSPGKRFVESLALWLKGFAVADRQAALAFVLKKLVFVSDEELSHLVASAYPDVVVPERLRLVAEETGIGTIRVAEIARQRRFEELRIKSLYLGLSDGARTSALRRASGGDIGNEQVSHAYELGPEKIDDMLEELRRSLQAVAAGERQSSRFNLVWLVDDFSGSGHTYIRYDPSTGRYKGKIRKAYEILTQRELVDTAHFEVFLLLYVATRQAMDHIEYWSERFTADHGYKPLELRVVCSLDADLRVAKDDGSSVAALANGQRYYDPSVFDRHMAVGGTTDARFGFAACGLPIVLCHNTPNNSLYILWGGDQTRFPGLFPRVSRHQEV